MDTLKHWKNIAKKFVFNYMKTNLDPKDYYDDIMSEYIDNIMQMKIIMYDVLSPYYCGLYCGIYGGYFRDKIMYELSESSIEMKIRLFWKLINTEKHDIDIYIKARCIIKRCTYDNIVDKMNKLFSEKGLPQFEKDELFWSKTNSPHDTHDSAYNYICLKFKIESDHLLYGTVFGIDFSSWDVYNGLDDISINRMNNSGYCTKGDNKYMDHDTIVDQIKNNNIDICNDMYYQLKVTELNINKYVCHHIYGIDNSINEVNDIKNGYIAAKQYNNNYTQKVLCRYHKMINYGFNIISKNHLHVPTKYLDLHDHGCDKDFLINVNEKIDLGKISKYVYLNYSNPNSELCVCGRCGQIYMKPIKKACNMLDIAEDHIICDIFILCQK